MRIANVKDQYLTHLSLRQFQGPQELLLQAEHNATALNKFHMCISAADGATLAWLLRSQNIQSFIEIGSLTGYSGLWALSAIPPKGQFITCEIDPVHSAQTKEIFAALAQKQKIAAYQVLEGDARETLKTLSGTYDGIFIDANKPAYADYLTWAESHVRQGGLIMVDNAFLQGVVYDKTLKTQFSEKNLELFRSVNERLMDPNKYDSALFAGSDGLIVATKKF